LGRSCQGARREARDARLERLGRIDQKGKAAESLADMPSLIRFLVVCVVLGALGGAATIYLAYFVHPHTREMIVRVPTDKLGQ
jgi:hypothetical protein